MGRHELNELLELLEAAANIASTIIQTESSCMDVSCVFTGNRGRPRYKIPKNHLESLLDLGFAVPFISRLLNVSTITIERRMAEFGLSIRDRFSVISDANFDSRISQILHEFPNIGYHRVPQSKVLESAKREDSSVNEEGELGGCVSAIVAAVYNKQKKIQRKGTTIPVAH